MDKNSTLVSDGPCNFETLYDNIREGGIEGCWYTLFDGGLSPLSFYVDSIDMFEEEPEVCQLQEPASDE